MAENNSQKNIFSMKNCRAVSSPNSIQKTAGIGLLQLPSRLSPSCSASSGAVKLSRNIKKHFSTQTFRLVNVGKAQLLLITLTMALFCSSVSNQGGWCDNNTRVLQLEAIQLSLTLLVTPVCFPL